MSSQVGVKRMRSYWVVSPNVNYDEATVSDWRQASVLGHAAFMGWGPDHKQIGYKFAHKIAPGDVILIARRHKSKPEIVGFGVVWGQYKRTIKGVKTPKRFGSMRKLSPFIPQSEAPPRIRLVDALGHTMSLVKLHPDHRKAHALVCKWIEDLLSKNKKRSSGKQAPKKDEPEEQVRVVAPPRNYQLDYKVRSKQQVILAKKKEDRLLKRYRRWLRQRGRNLQPVNYGKLKCDGFEEERRNLIEAKSSISREHIRMAVGQLLDYAFQGEKKFGRPNMGILLPKKPGMNSYGWLRRLKIHLIWLDRGGFLDDADRQFT